jgi:outer membrane protein
MATVTLTIFGSPGVNGIMRIMRRLIVSMIGLLLFVASINSGKAAELPLWEAGIGVTGLTVPDYRGSNQQRFYALPLPYVVYRGEIFKVDRNGVYGLVFQSDRVHLNISADGGVPVESGSNTARRDMPDLDPTFQIGPKLEICLVSDCKADTLVQLRLPVRAVVAAATDLSHYKGIGVVFHPQLNFDFKNMPAQGWIFGFAFGPIFATQEYHEYYYGVPDYQAIPGFRPAYRAKGGYSGSQLVMAVTKRYRDFWFGAFASYDELSGAVFDNSPLMRTKQAFMAGFGVAWVFSRSKTLVQSPE